MRGLITLVALSVSYGLPGLHARAKHMKLIFPHICGYVVKNLKLILTAIIIIMRISVYIGLLKHSAVMPFSSYPMRIQGFRLYQPVILMVCEEITYLSFIFPIFKGTGRINKPAAGFKHAGCSIKYLTLPYYALGDICRTPLSSCGLILTHHAFSGAGRIYYNLVKIITENIC